MVIVDPFHDQHITSSQSKCLRHYIYLSKYSLVAILYHATDGNEDACRVVFSVGYWAQIEQYIEANSEASFTHGICPDCARALYPGLGAHRDRQKSHGGET